MKIEPGYLLFVGRATSPTDAKTASGIRQWRPEKCVGQWRLAKEAIDLGLPDMLPANAHAAGARTMIIGVAPFGGAIDPEWIDAALVALSAGLDVASGMHARLSDQPALVEAAARSGRKLHDVRHADRKFPVATGVGRRGKRLLTVGTDCAVGKKYAALAIHAALAERGADATFRATGQTGILIAGGGVAIDAVVADFISGAAETLSPDNDPAHWDVIEGQGSLFHPAYAGVSLGLMHGSQPDAIVVCHDPARSHIDGYPQYPLPSLDKCIDTHLQAAQLTNPRAECVGIAINGSRLNATELAAEMSAIEKRFGLPCIDPVATGAGRIVDRLLGAEPPR